VTSRMSFIVSIPIGFPFSITARRLILLWFMSLAASVIDVPGSMVINGLDIASATLTSEGRMFFAATRWTMSLSVIIPEGFPTLSVTRMQPMLCLTMSLDTVAAVSVSLAVMGGLDIMSRTSTSGSSSWTDNAKSQKVGLV